MGGGTAKVLIYGISQQAQQLFQLISDDGAAQVHGFVADREYIVSDSLLGKGVHEFGGLARRFPPDEYQIALSFGYRNMVGDRREKFLRCKGEGYTLFTYVSRRAVSYADEIGEGCIVLPLAYLAPFTKLGRGCFLENGASVAHHSQCGDFCFLAPNAVVCGGTTIGDNCFIGANAVVTNGLAVSRRTLVSAGARLTRGTREGSVCFPGRGSTLLDKRPEEYI